MKNNTLNKYIEILKNEKLYVEDNIKPEIKEKKVEIFTYDSRQVKKHTLFLCKGANFKKEFLENALKNGAIAYVAEETYKDYSKPFIIVSDIRKTIAVLSDLYTNYPEKEINMIGITGTKGKSTTTYYLKYILDEYMKNNNKNDTAIISSIDTYDGVETKEAVLTTPEALELHKHIRNAVDSKIDNLVMEVCSQALKTERVYGILYKYGIFLNISEDHISNIEHKDYEDYFSSKLKIFDQTEIAVINLNSDNLERILKSAQKTKKIITFGTTEDADVYGYDIKKNGLKTTFKVKTNKFNKEIELTMPGLFNVENALAAIAVANDMNIPYEDIFNGLKKAKASGRMEVYSDKNKKVIVIVDYAHNKLSFQKLYESTIKEYPKRNIITVFGCPGNHAQNRRKDLGELSGKYSNMNYLTMEDPRNEDPEKICEEISEYIKKENGNFKIIVDRGQAIKQAILEAKPNSVILITGKGNETVQYVKGKYIECETDVQYAKKYLKELDGKKSKTK